MNLNKYFRLDLIKDAKLSPNGFPIIKGDDFIPIEIMPFNFLLSNEDTKKCPHFFIDDYQFERIWHNPYRYVNILLKYKFTIGCDFSMYLNLPKPQQIFNLYKNRVLDYFFQNNGIKVIPTVSWSDKESFNWCFEGIENKSPVALSTIGCHNNISTLYFQLGFNKMIEMINPSFIICYGKPFDFMLDCVIYKYDHFLGFH